MSEPNVLILVVNLAVLFANIAVFALTLKLYTEYFKDKSQASRRYD